MRFALVAALIVVGGSVVIAAPPSTTASARSAVAELGQQLKQATSFAERGDWAKAATMLDEASLRARLRAPMSIDVALPTLGPHRGRGVYERLPDGVLPGRTLHLMLEVSGVHAVKDGARFRHDLDVTGRFFVVHGDGTPDEDLGERALGRHSVTSFYEQPTQVVGAEVALGGAPAGAYAVVVTVVDRATGVTASSRVPFSLRDATP